MKTVLIYSGGLDSTVALYYLKSQGHQLKALSVDYGQRHKKEIEFAKYHCAKLGIEHQVADLTGITHLLAGSSQTSANVDVPEGHYAEESMKLTVVPNRNMIMLSVAIGWAISQKANSVAYAAHAGDHAIYPDCRPEFADAIDHAAKLADWHRVSLLRPFVQWSKADIAAEAKRLNIEIEKTWSCYKGLDVHCGKCGTCTERIEAFQLAGVPDPTVYA
jgi:7-cyano-7-deazaguanine synthase